MLSTFIANFIVIVMTPKSKVLLRLLSYGGIFRFLGVWWLDWMLLAFAVVCCVTTFRQWWSDYCPDLFVATFKCTLTYWARVCVCADGILLKCVSSGSFAYLWSAFLAIWWQSTYKHTEIHTLRALSTQIHTQSGTKDTRDTHTHTRRDIEIFIVIPIAINCLNYFMNFPLFFNFGYLLIVSFKLCSLLSKLFQKCWNHT